MLHRQLPWRTVTVAAAAGRLIALKAAGPALGGGAATAATGRAGITAVRAPDGAAGGLSALKAAGPARGGGGARAARGRAGKTAVGPRDGAANATRMEVIG